MRHRLFSTSTIDAFEQVLDAELLFQFSVHSSTTSLCGGGSGAGTLVEPDITGFAAMAASTNSIEMRNDLNMIISFPINRGFRKIGNPNSEVISRCLV